jgi:hypothetical protein
MLHIHDVNEDDETIIHLHEYMFYVQHIKFYLMVP